MMCTVRSPNTDTVCGRKVAYTFKSGTTVTYSCDRVKCRRAIYHSFATHPEMKPTTETPKREEIEEFVLRLEESIRVQTAILERCKTLLERSAALRVL